MPRGKRDTTQQHVEIATINNETFDLENCLKFDGSMNQCIEFLNKWIGVFELKYKRESEIVIKLNENDWCLFDELVQKGVITLE